MTNREDSALLFKQGAEAKIYVTKFCGRPTVIKERFSKKYRHQRLDELLCKERTRMEARTLIRCRAAGIHTPAVYFVDPAASSIYMEYLKDSITIKDYIVGLTTSQPKDKIADSMISLGKKIGLTLGKMHDMGVIHGDLTTSNMLLRPSYETSPVILIDFGLSYVDASVEDKAVDLYVLERAFTSTHPTLTAKDDANLFDVVILGEYLKNTKKPTDILNKLEEVRMRGRKRTMVG